MSPMCQYSADDGLPMTGIFGHLAARAAAVSHPLRGGDACFSPIGRITPHVSGLWNGHAARCAGADRITCGEPRRWVPMITARACRTQGLRQPALDRDEAARELLRAAGETIGPSPLPQTPDAPPPREMDQGDIDRVVESSVTLRAVRARRVSASSRCMPPMATSSISFLSPLSNHRSDAYGGSLEKRARLLNQVIDAITQRMAGRILPLFVRISATDWSSEGGSTSQPRSQLSRMLAQRGDVDLIDWLVRQGRSPPGDPALSVISGPVSPRRSGAKRVSRRARSVLISAPEQAEEILAGGRADLVILGRVACSMIRTGPCTRPPGSGPGTSPGGAIRAREHLLIRRGRRSDSILHSVIRGRGRGADEGRRVYVRYARRGDRCARSYVGRLPGRCGEAQPDPVCRLRPRLGA